MLVQHDSINISGYEPIFRSSQRKYRVVVNKHLTFYFCETYRVFYILNFKKFLKFFKIFFTLFKMIHQEPTPFSLEKKRLFLSYYFNCFSILNIEFSDSISNDTNNFRAREFVYFFFNFLYKIKLILNIYYSLYCSR